jgi:hypothetical protein
MEAGTSQTFREPNRFASKSNMPFYQLMSAQRTIRVSPRISRLLMVSTDRWHDVTASESARARTINYRIASGAIGKPAQDRSREGTQEHPENETS